MKNLIFIGCILIILFKTGNVLSNNKIFNVNNIEISREISQNQEKLISKAFLEAFNKLIKRLLMEDDYRRFSNTNLEEIKKLISYYQIGNSNTETKEDKENIKFNVFFDKERVHKFFYDRNILYSDIINTEVILFPLLRKEKQYFIYTKNYFYENWNNNEQPEDLIQYILPTENIENIEKITLNKSSIYKIDISDFFKEYNSNNVVFANIEVKNNIAEVFLNTRIQGKTIKKTLSIKKNNNFNQIEFYRKIISKINNAVRDLIKSQNLIDVRTPSFLNVKIKLNATDDLIEFNNRLQKIDLIDNFYVQQMNKDYVLVKIKYLGKINKIINKLKDQKINLRMIEGQWQLNVI